MAQALNLADLAEPGNGGKAIFVWTWDDAPDTLRALSQHGGDERVVVFVPDGVDDQGVVDRIAYGIESSEHVVPGGIVTIVAG